MEIANFNKLIENRKDWIKISKANNFDFYSILGGLYKDPSHFIYEILQNAEDEGAKKVKFELFEDRLDIYHDGKVFDFEDIDGVTGIGISDKKDDINTIGKFGVGFKSVFAITGTPFIYSGDYNIKIEDFVIPSEVGSNVQINETKISLPFNHELRSKEEVFNLVSKKLKNIGLKTLLFLKNIDEIKWKTSHSRGHYLKSSEDDKKVKGAKRTTIISETNTEEFLVIEKPIKIENKELKIEVAYKIGKDKRGKEIIIPETDSKLVVFFPTEKVTFLNFLIQGPYKTTPNRENIPLDDEQNKIIIEETGNLVAESIPLIKNLGYLDTNFLNLLPINPRYKENEQIYSVIYEKVKEKFLTDEELLPANNGRYTKVSDAVLAGSKELTEFLNQDDIQYLFSKSNWLETNITYARTKELRDYLINELEIGEIDFEDFAREITSDFLQLKSDIWVIDFYCHLLNQQALWREKSYPYEAGILRTKPIIRLENNEHIVPFGCNGKTQVYLPAETRSKYKTVKRALVENENSLKFLKELGLTKPDLFSEIREFILPKYHKGKVNIENEEYFEDFEKLLTAYKKIRSDKKDEFISQLSDIAFIDSINPVTNENHLRKPSEVYLIDLDLQKYFYGVDSVYFVSEKLYRKFDQNLVSFLKDIGVEDKPRRIEINGNLSYEEKGELRKQKYCDGWSGDIHEKDYEYEGLKEFVKQIDTEKSFLLWKLLLKNIEALNSQEARDFFEGKYSWFYYREFNNSFDVKFLKTLRQINWLFDKAGKFKKSFDLTFSELSDAYIKDNPNINILIEKLKFRPDVIDQLPEEYKNKLDIVKDISEEELKEAVAEIKKKKEPKINERVPRYSPDEIPVRIENIDPKVLVPPDLEEQPIDGKDPNDEPKEQREGEPPKATNNKRAKEIGDWGESYTFKTLKERFQKNGNIEETDFGFKTFNNNNELIEVLCLNKYRNVGKGYDFVIKKNGTEEEYIEVKTKQQEDEEFIRITGTQWEFARKLFNQGEGDKYWIYVVLNAESLDAKIRSLNNPIKLWKDGKLYAHPINFKL